MNITVLAVDKLRDKGIRQAADKYVRLLRPYCSLVELEVRPVSGKASDDEIKKGEGERLFGAQCSAAYSVALDPGGKQMSSEELATFINERQNSGLGHIAFLIGGSMGLSEAVKTKSNFIWSLSTLTFAHELTRVILLEQLYRAFTILNKHPYHK